MRLFSFIRVVLSCQKETQQMFFSQLSSCLSKLKKSMTVGKKKEKALKWRKPQRSKSNRLEMRANRTKSSILRNRQKWHKQSLSLELLFEWPTLFDFYNLFDIFPFYWFLIYHAYLLPFYSPDLNLTENLWTQRKVLHSKECMTLMEG